MTAPILCGALPALVYDRADFVLCAAGAVS